MDANSPKPPTDSDELEQAGGADAEPEAPVDESAAQPAQPATTEANPPEPVPPEKPVSASFKDGVVGFIFGNKYLVIFALVLVLSAGGIFYVVQLSKKQTSQVQRVTSLTAEELTALRGNTTVVGDAQTVLDVQSNAVFEGQVVMRNSLEVAGNVKINTPLSLPALTVNGTSTLGQIAGNSLSVRGDSALQSDLNVQGSLSVAGGANFGGAVAVQQLSVTNLILSGDLLLPRHLSTTGGIPGRTNGAALGSDGTSSVSGSDTAGTITFNTGTGTSAGTMIVITFAQKYTRTPHVVVTPIGSGGANLNYYIVNRTANGFTLSSTNAPPINSNFSFDYIVID